MDMLQVLNISNIDISSKSVVFIALAKSLFEPTKPENRFNCLFIISPLPTLALLEILYHTNQTFVDILDKLNCGFYFENTNMFSSGPHNSLNFNNKFELNL